MAKFIQMDSVWVNIDMIVSMWHDEKDDKTYIFSADDPNNHFTFQGNAINKILDANNDVNMHDKLVTNFGYRKYQGTLSTILSRLDNIISMLKKGK